MKRQVDRETLDYYDSSGEQFVRDTLEIDFHEIQDEFLSYLKKGAKILDFGCGSGRDAKYFLDKGYSVEALDGSETLCRLAAKYAGIPVRHQLFQELEEKDRYDGIWACASVLHVKKTELPDVFQRLTRALRPGGILYVSFKYGEFEGFRGGRYFTDFQEDSFRNWAGQFSTLEEEKMWITRDARRERSGERWLNIILRRADCR